MLQPTCIKTFLIYILELVNISNHNREIKDEYIFFSLWLALKASVLTDCILSVCFVH